MVTTFPTIVLGAAPKSKPKDGIIHLGGVTKKKKPKRSIKKAIRETAIVVLGAGAITAAVFGAPIVAGALGAAGAATLLLRGAKAVIPKTIRGKAGAVTAAGILVSSSTARKAVVQLPKTLFTSGQKLGKIIDDPSSAGKVLGITEEKTLKGKIIQGAKVAGVAGAVIAAGIGVTALTKGIIKKKAEGALKVPELAGLKDIGIVSPRPVGVVGGSPLIQTQPRPMGALTQPVTQQPIQNIIQIQVS